MNRTKKPFTIPPAIVVVIVVMLTVIVVIVTDGAVDYKDLANTTVSGWIGYLQGQKKDDEQ